MSDGTRHPATREWIARAGLGDSAAFAELHRRFAPRVRGLVALRLGKRLAEFVDAEDVVQEVFAEAFTKLDRFRADSGEGEFACWLATMVERRLKDRARAQRADKRGGGRIARFADLDTTTIAGAEPVGREPSPSEDLSHRELQARIESAMLHLTPRDRELIYLRQALEMEFAEIAVHFGFKNAATACAMHHKALARLEEHLRRSRDAGG